jgi:hypothetical protein
VSVQDAAVKGILTGGYAARQKAKGKNQKAKGQTGCANGIHVFAITYSESGRCAAIHFCRRARKRITRYILPLAFCLLPYLEPELQAELRLARVAET